VGRPGREQRQPGGGGAAAAGVPAPRVVAAGRGAHGARGALRLLRGAAVGARRQRPGAQVGTVRALRLLLAAAWQPRS
jgi:hypothetical protein